MELSNGSNANANSNREGTKPTTDEAFSSNNNNSNNLSLVPSLLKETSDRALEMLPDTLLRHWMLWPIVHTLNFYYNPIHHRVLVQNVVLIFWSGYLSHLNNGGLVTPEKEVELAEVAAAKAAAKAAVEAIAIAERPHTAKGGVPLASSPRWGTREGHAN